MMVIYKTTNLINGKYYIGKQQTYTKSYLGSGMALRCAIKKYGRQNFKKEILEECQSETELKNKELWWLDTLDAIKNKNCYNLVRETSSNNHRSYDDPEYKKRLSESLKKTLSSPKEKLRLSKQNSGKNNPMYGKVRSVEFRKMVSRYQKGKHLSDETKEKLRISHLGILPSVEAKEKMRVSHKKRWDTIMIEMTLNGNFHEFFNRYEFLSFIKNYNSKIPQGRVRGIENKRISWKRALKGEYSFIKIIPK
jgi:group I intron endonuclease